jgi:hypothetical protein
VCFWYVPVNCASAMMWVPIASIKSRLVAPAGPAPGVRTEQVYCI